jgi:hypothetical protein
MSIEVNDEAFRVAQIRGCRQAFEHAPVQNLKRWDNGGLLRL